MKTPAGTLSTTLAANPVLAEGESLRAFETSPGLLSRAWRWLRSYGIGQSSGRRLRVAETVSLGEKRFVAVVEVDGRHFLLAGGPANIALLAHLKEDDDFEDVLKKTMTVPEKQVTLQPEKPTRKPARRAKKPATRSIKNEPAAPGKKTAPVAVAKKQPKVHTNQGSRQEARTERFGGIPGAPRYGTKAFEKWLEHAVPTEEVRTPQGSKVAHTQSQPVAETPNLPSTAPLPPKQTLNEWLQEARNLPEKTPVQPISEPVAQSTVEEYA